MSLCVWLITTILFSRCKDTKVERNGKIYFDIPEMKYRRRARRAKDTKYFSNSQNNFLKDRKRPQFATMFISVVVVESFLTFSLHPIGRRSRGEGWIKILTTI